MIPEPIHSAYRLYRGVRSWARNRRKKMLRKKFFRMVDGTQTPDAPLVVPATWPDEHWNRMIPVHENGLANVSLKMGTAVILTGLLLGSALVGFLVGIETAEPVCVEAEVLGL